MAIRANLIEPEGAGVDLDRDRELVVRYQRGETTAFDELYRRYYDRIHVFCLRRVGDRHVAEELAQDAFLRAFLAMPRFGGERRFYPWMTVIAQRLCIDHHRRSGRTEPAAVIDLGTVEPEHDGLFAAVDRDQLHAAVGRLAPRHREVLGLREQKSWSYQQIADHLDVPITTVEALLHRARKALRREYLAVTGERTRLGAVPLLGALAAAATRLRLRVERLTDSAGWAAQYLAPAIAGVAALGIVLSPLAPDAARPPDTRAVDATLTTAATTAAPPPAADATPVAAATAAPVAGSSISASTPTAAAPTPVADLGLVVVSQGPDAVAAADASNAEQPFQADLGLVRFGLDPIQIVKDALEPGTGGTP